MSSDQAGLLLLLVISIVLFTGVGRKWGGRATTWVFWKAPKGALRYAWDSNMALAGDIGRRVTVLVVYGAFLWGARWVWTQLDLPGRWVLSVLLLLWFLYAVNVVSFIRHARAGASRNRQLAREQYRVLHEMRADVREAMAGIGRGGRDGEGGVDVLGPLRRTPHPVDQEAAERRHWEDKKIRGWLPEETRDMPLGQEFEPALPRWMRRRVKKEQRKDNKRED